MFYTYISPRYGEDEKKSIINRTAVQIMNIVEENFSVFYWMNDPNQFPDDAKTRFEHIFAYIYKNTRGRMTIEELGALEHINPNYLSQFLKKTSFLGTSRAQNIYQSIQGGAFASHNGYDYRYILSERVFRSQIFLSCIQTVVRTHSA